MVIGLQLALSYAERSGRYGPPCTHWEVIAMLKRIITWAAVIFLVYYLVSNPTGAAHFVTGIINWLRGAGRSLATFFNSL